MARKKEILDTRAVAALISITALLFLAYGLVYQVGRPAETNQQPENVLARKTYRDSSLGLSFEYPGIYQVTEYPDVGDENHKIILLSSQRASDAQMEASPAISFDIFLSALSGKNDTPLKWMKLHPESNFHLSDGTYHQVTTEGKDIITYRWSGLYNGISTLFTKNNTIVIASVTYDDPNDAIVKDFESIAKTISLR